MWLQSLLENMLFSIKSFLLWWWSTIGQATSTWLHSLLLLPSAKLHLTLEAKVTNGHLSLFLPSSADVVCDPFENSTRFSTPKLGFFKILHLTDFELDTWRFLSQNLLEQWEVKLLEFKPPKTCCLLNSPRSKQPFFNELLLLVLLENEGWEIWSMTNSSTQSSSVFSLNNSTKITNHLNRRSNQFFTEDVALFKRQTTPSQLAYNFRNSQEKK